MQDLAPSLKVETKKCSDYPNLTLLSSSAVQRGWRVAPAPAPAQAELARWVEREANVGGVCVGWAGAQR